MKILVAHSCHPTLAQIRRILESAGHEVVTARTSVEALGAVHGSYGFELVVAGMEMPEMDGLELLKSLRADRETVGLRCIIIVEDGENSWLQKELFDWGAKFLPKELIRTNLLTLVELK